MTGVSVVETAEHFTAQIPLLLFNAALNECDLVMLSEAAGKRFWQTQQTIATLVT